MDSCYLASAVVLSLYIYELQSLFRHIMALPGQKRGDCGHLLTAFDKNSFCARCCDEDKGSDPCVAKQDCKFMQCTDKRPSCLGRYIQLQTYEKSEN